MADLQKREDETTTEFALRQAREEWTAPLRVENERLRKAFAELLEGAQDMRSYVPDYFANKWRHDEALGAARKALEGEGEWLADRSAAEQDGW
jgi:hypothetical protein